MTIVISESDHAHYTFSAQSVIMCTVKEMSPKHKQEVTPWNRL